MWKFMDYTESLKGYVYSEWFLHGLSVAFDVAVALGVIWLAVNYIKRRFTLWRTGTMTPERYKEWQRQVWADRAVDLGDKLVSAGIWSRGEMNEFLIMIGQRCHVNDLVPKERVERSSTEKLKEMIRSRLKNPPKPKGGTLGEQLMAEVRKHVNGKSTGDKTK